MVKKVLQIGYEPERDRLTWDGWEMCIRDSISSVKKCREQSQSRHT